MAVKRLYDYEIPSIEMDDKYKADIWNIKEWDYYKNEEEKQQKRWDKRSNKYNGCFDFTLCNNLWIREELKYVISTIIEKGTNVAILGDYFDRFKILCRFLNETNKYDSLFDYKNEISVFERYLIFKVNNKSIVGGGKRITATMKIQLTTRQNRSITFFKYAISTIEEYYIKDLPLMERDMWTPQYLISQHFNANNGRRLDFSEIKQHEIKQHAKEFCKFKIAAGKVGYDSIYSYLKTIRKFSVWLYDYDSSIEHLSQLNRDIIEDFFYYLRVETNYSNQVVNVTILYLKMILETMELLELDNLPNRTLILTQDYSFKPKVESKYFTEEEMQNINNVIKHMNKTDGKMVFCLKTLGIRISELFSLKPSNIHQTDDGSFYLDIYQSKIDESYIKPLIPQVYAVLNSEIEKNRKRLGYEPEYIFLNSNNHKMEYSSFCRRVNKVFLDHNVLDRAGNILHFQTHRFRATFATNLINSGYDAETTSKMLGHKRLDSLQHYIKIHDKTVLKELSPRLEKDNALINNIYSMEKLSFDQTKPIGVPLCNGWCARDIEKLGACKKANTCLTCGLFEPSPEFLNNYCMQLEDVNATIEVAKANDMEALLNKNLALKERLEEIIRIVKEKLE